MDHDLTPTFAGTIQLRSIDRLASVTMPRCAVTIDRKSDRVLSKSSATFAEIHM